MASHLPPLRDTLLRAIGATAVAGLRSDPRYLGTVITAGLIEPSVVEADPASSPDPVGLIREIGEALGAAFGEDPGLVAALGMDALDLLGRDAVGPSSKVARIARVERVVAVCSAEVLGAVPELARSRGGTLAAALGGACVILFEDAEAAVRMVLDAADADESLCAGVDRGEAMPAGREVYGPVVGSACRLAATAAPGELLASQALRDPLGSPDGVVFGMVSPQSGDGEGPLVWRIGRS